MSKIDNYDLIFFDFDGLLVNTEHLHYLAYQRMCSSRARKLDWNFEKYCSIAHRSSEGLKNEIYKDFPDLYEEEPNWSVLYAEKKRLYQEILQEGHVELMPGVEKMLKTVQAKRCCVVTNSFLEQIGAIREQIPLLQTIPYWITREDYTFAKPDPDPYLTAKKKYAKPGDRIIGFEDTLRGLESLKSAQVEGVIISSVLEEEMKKELFQKKIPQFSSFEEFLLS